VHAAGPLDRTEDPRHLEVANVLGRADRLGQKGVQPADQAAAYGTLAIADHQAAAGYETYVYQFDYVPADDPLHLGAAHCVELPFFFNTIDAWPDSPMLGEPTAAVRHFA
jgi:carboxylesterase type B